METIVQPKKYTIIEKLFKITPENNIGQTSYSLRIILIFIIFYLIGGVVPLFMMQLQVVPVMTILYILMWVSVSIFLYSTYCLSIKRVRESWWKEWIPKLVFSALLIVLISTVFDILPEDTDIKSWWFTFYIIYLSAIKTKPSEKMNEVIPTNTKNPLS